VDCSEGNACDPNARCVPAQPGGGGGGGTGSSGGCAVSTVASPGAAWLFTLVALLVARGRRRAAS
jgi:MYXO-CTERM domain-containing protein